MMNFYATPYEIALTQQGPLEFGPWAGKCFYLSVMD